MNDKRNDIKVLKIEMVFETYKVECDFLYQVKNVLSTENTYPMLMSVVGT